MKMSGRKRNEEYLITDPPLRALLVFSIPMILGSLFQQIYNMADSIIVGHFVGQNALAAVGASAALTNVFICVAVGAGAGASVIVSQRFGARDYREMKESIRTSMIFFLLLSAALGLFGFVFSGPIMRALDTPDEVIGMAVLYLRVYFAGFPFLFMYNIIASMFNAVGESRIPLYFLIFSSVLNVFMDIFMVARLGMGVFGAALATLIAQGISAVLSFLLFVRAMRRYDAEAAYFSGRDLKKILSYAVPTIIQQSTVSIGMLLVQSVVNRFGAEALAGFSATGRIENIIAAVFVSIGNAVSPFTAQNFGASKKERIPKGYHAGLLLDLIAAAIAFALIEPFARPIAGLFLGSKGTAEAYRVAIGYMRWLGLFCFLLGAKVSTDGVLKGIGRMRIFMISNLCNLFIRVIVAMTLAPQFGIEFVWYAVPVGWAVNVFISCLAYRKNRKREFS
jgi:putative MATE family efflux protein